MLQMNSTHQKAQAELDDSQAEIQQHNDDVEQQVGLVLFVAAEHCTCRTMLRDAVPHEQEPETQNLSLIWAKPHVRLQSRLPLLIMSLVTHRFKT